MKSKLKDILIKELNYSEYAATVTSNDLENLHEQQLREALESWLHDRTVTDVVINGFSALQLMQEKNFTYPAALIALDWLLTEPDIAKKELEKDYIMRTHL